jgi:hypothetical protein
VASSVEPRGSSSCATATGSPSWLMSVTCSNSTTSRDNVECERSLACRGRMFLLAVLLQCCCFHSRGTSCGSSSCATATGSPSWLMSVTYSKKYNQRRGAVGHDNVECERSLACRGRVSLLAFLLQCCCIHSRGTSCAQSSSQLLP